MGIIRIDIIDRAEGSRHIMEGNMGIRDIIINMNMGTSKFQEMFTDST
jgi:hypothetical protein